MEFFQIIPFFFHLNDGFTKLGILYLLENITQIRCFSEVFNHKVDFSLALLDHVADQFDHRGHIFQILAKNRLLQLLGSHCVLVELGKAKLKECFRPVFKGNDTLQPSEFDKVPHELNQVRFRVLRFDQACGHFLAKTLGDHVREGLFQKVEHDAQTKANRGCLLERSTRCIAW